VVVGERGAIGSRSASITRSPTASLSAQRVFQGTLDQMSSISPGNSGSPLFNARQGDRRHHGKVGGPFGERTWPFGQR
jgi:hypothetical protein